MLSTLIVTAFVIAFLLIAALGHLLLFIAVVFGRDTVFAENGEKSGASQPRPAHAVR